MEAIQLEIGLDLVSYVKTQEEENLIESIRQMRRDIEIRHSFLVPPIRVCDNGSLPPRISTVHSRRTCGIGRVGKRRQREHAIDFSRRYHQQPPERLLNSTNP